MSNKIVVRKPDGKQGLVNESNIGGANAVLIDIDCDASVFVGAAVRMSVGGVAENAIADSITNSNVIGIVESKSSATKCNIRIAGYSLPVFAGLDVTKEYFLSDTIAGGIQTSAPTLSGHIKVKLGQPFSATEFLYMKGDRIIRA